jgi:UDP-N-acetylglucosamine--N-acetylmuramyl-(pentapeptide) pyrophosphoryl-undecaprenol N-acetylglucosamine transferase
MYLQKSSRKQRLVKENTPVTIVFAVGGTAGHVYPAMALALEIIQLQPQYQVMFIGHGLSTNTYFDKKQFPSYKDISSASISLKEVFKIPKGCLLLLKGMLQAFNYLKNIKPTLVIGFGSFHSLPVLMSAYLNRIPYVLFESNAILGKVNKFFSRGAYLTAYQLFDLKEARKNPSFVKIAMPTRDLGAKKIDPYVARERLGLHQDTLTLLMFGGSQGAKSLNALFLKMLPYLKKRLPAFQVMHLIGFNTSLEEVKHCYEALDIPAYVKIYEENMYLAYSAADLLISRSGANTIAEQLHYQIPAVFVPFPYLTDNHQAFNAAYVCHHIQGGVLLKQKTLTVELFAEQIQRCLETNQYTRMKKALENFQKDNHIKPLSELILNMLG